MMDNRHTLAPKTTAHAKPRVAPVCLGCGYELSGIVSATPASTACVCPECARPFDWAKPTTVGPRPRFAYEAASFAPPAWVNIPYALLWLPLLLLFGSPTGHLSDGASGALGVVLLLTVLFWSAPFVVHAIARLVLVFQGSKQPRWRWTWSGIPVILFFALLIQSGQVVWELRWWHARGKFDVLREKISKLKPGESLPSTPLWVGSFCVTKIEREEKRSRFTGWEYREEIVYWLGWPDTGYSDMTPAIIDGFAKDPGRWPVTVHVDDGWWAGMDPT